MWLETVKLMGGQVLCWSLKQLCPALWSHVQVLAWPLPRQVLCALALRDVLLSQWGGLVNWQPLSSLPGGTSLGRRGKAGEAGRRADHVPPLRAGQLHVLVALTRVLLSRDNFMPSSQTAVVT